MMTEKNINEYEGEIKTITTRMTKDKSTMLARIVFELESANPQDDFSDLLTLQQRFVRGEDLEHDVF